VQARVKTRKKLRSKYLDPEKNYTCLDDITDLAGLRVITYYEDEIDKVVEVVGREFRVDASNTVDKRRNEPDRFGYRAINLVCKHAAKRTSDVPYNRFSSTVCEIQVTSILGHAWAEIEHDWYDLKDAYPDEIKRRFSRLAALLELAGSEFADIREKRAQYEKSVALQVEAEVPDVLLDAVSLRSYIDKEPLICSLDSAISKIRDMPVREELTDDLLAFQAKAANFVGLATLQQLTQALRRFEKTVIEYVSICNDIWPKRPAVMLTKGISIFHLTTLLAARESKDNFIRIIEVLNVTLSNREGQFEAAKQALERCPG
jgi:ppGpp synthetase/RelA/SpoT-type nucleotidyltranferase